MNAAHDPTRETAGEPRDEPVEEFVELGAKNDEVDEVLAEQERHQANKVGEQDEGSSRSRWSWRRARRRLTRPTSLAAGRGPR